MAHRGASPNQLDVNLISIGKVLAKFQRYWCLQKDTIYERKVPQGCKNESKKSTNSMFWLFDMIVVGGGGSVQSGQSKDTCVVTVRLADNSVLQLLTHKSHQCVDL